MRAKSACVLAHPPVAVVAVEAVMTIIISYFWRGSQCPPVRNPNCVFQSCYYTQSTVPMHDVPFLVVR